MEDSQQQKKIPNLINIAESSIAEKMKKKIPFNKLQCACVQNVSHFDLSRG